MNAGTRTDWRLWGWAICLFGQPLEGRPGRVRRRWRYRTTPAGLGPHRIYAAKTGDGIQGRQKFWTDNLLGDLIWRDLV